MISSAAYQSVDVTVTPCPSRSHDHDSVNSLIANWKSGDDGAAEVLYRRYIDSVTRTVACHLTAKFRDRIGTEDMVQNVFLAVFIRLKKDTINFRNDASFGCWIRRFAKNKVRRCIRYEVAMKRSINREAGSLNQMAANEGSYELATDHRVTAVDHLIQRETLVELRRTLDRKCYRVVEMLMAGYNQAEIAKIVRLSSRTIRRRIKVIREVLRAAV
jgi:RNA polymerase sigma factor (sigma-70 family)